jgi:two-component system, cell cycle sensor histidine kinase and response regulator CckA
MKNGRNGKHELIAELESAQLKVDEIEFRLKELGQASSGEIKHRQTMSGLHDSELRYRRLFETAQDGILILDANSGKIEDVNPFLEDMLGFTKEEFIGKQLWEVGAFIDTAASKVAFKELQQKKYIRYDDLPLKTKDGRLIEVEFVSNVYLVGQQKVIQCNIRNITERARSEEMLRKSEERYRRLVEFLPDAVMVHSFGKFVFVNPAAVKLLGAHDASELLDKPVLDIVHPDNKESVRLRIASGILENKPLPLIEEKLLRLDGKTIDVDVSAIPVEYGGVPAMQNVIRDITEQKKLQQDLFQSQKMQSIGILAGGIAHDFNNILAIILGHAELLKRSNITTQMRSENVSFINQAVQRGAALVRQILMYARKTNISFEPLSLKDLCQELISMLQQTFSKMITFKTIFPKDTPLILADHTQIHQALLNLFVNARDAMPNGGSITIEIKQQAGKQLKERFPDADQNMYICISVTDTGESMNEETRLRVFDPFFTTKDKGKGTGMGLSVVYGVVQAHHGFINVESELGRGTTFRLYFPVPDILQKPADSRNADTYEFGGTETILVVEDEPPLLSMLRYLLESKGYKVLTAQNGIEAIEAYQLHIHEIDLVLTDMGLPRMNGFEEFKKLKEIDPDVKVIFASGYLEIDVKPKLLKEGANGFLQKPYMPDEVLKILRETLDKKI